ncbi:MAG: NAD(P)-dependent alcohol dehydrogenase [Anaerolineae bacterium]|jgi:NADPH:quinone reductase-like Zn-dependent oxidoreductase
MKAIVWTKYGSPEGLELREVERPTPKADEVLIKVHATTVTAGDCEARRLQFPLGLGLAIRAYAGLIRPVRLTILGQELAGEIEAIGKEVTRFKEGDQVFASTGFGFGAYAEYTCLSERSDTGVMALKPVNITYEEAAAVPVGGLEALHFLRQADLQSGRKVLINGAGGSIGTLGVQLAKHFGAEVTAVDSTGKLDVLRSLGADHVIDYTLEDFTQRGEVYDAIFDVVGKAPYAGSMRSLSKNGVYLLANPNLSRLVRGRWTSMTSSKRVVSGASSPKTPDLLFLKDLIESGALRVVIDRRFPLEQMAEAHRYVEAGGKKGNVVITVAPDNGT